MNTPTVSYILVSLLTLFTFSNFVACGAKMYQVSLEDDHEPIQVARKKSLASGETSALTGVHASKGWVSLPIEYKLSGPLNAEQREGIVNAMKAWEMATGKSLFKIIGDDDRTGDSFRDLFSSLRDGINGHYLDGNWTKTGKSYQVLATTIWDTAVSDHQMIKTADIRFNSQYYVIGDSYSLKATPDKEVVDMETLALHEIGHLLGLTHISADDDSQSIMNPTIFIGEGLTNRRLSEGDIRRIQSVYGCAGDSCDISSIYTMINEPRETQLQLNADHSAAH